ncbi:MAG: nucleotidyltransferase family protein [Bryobacteraceae bacterium]|jgi:predicted nucleotidyltransferase
MNSDQVIATLRDHEPELRELGVASLSIFGSTARGDGQPDSDIDLLAGFDESRALSLLDLVGIELKLAGLLGQPVDLVEEGTLKPRVLRSVEADPIQRFTDVLEKA